MSTLSLFKCTQCPVDNLKGHIDSCHLLSVSRSKHYQTTWRFWSTKEVDCNSLTFDNGSGHIIVWFSHGNSSVFLKDQCSLLLLQSEGQQYSSPPGVSLNYRYELTKCIFPEVTELVIFHVNSSWPCNPPPATKDKTLSSSFHTMSWEKV